MDITQTNEYSQVLRTIKERILQAQYTALKAVNQELIQLYWDLGRIIAVQQEQHTWGESVVARLAKDLRVEFSGIRGFSLSNLWRMRSFYLTYKDTEKLATLSREISWSHNITIMERCKDNQEREFYLKMTKRFGWSYRVLAHQIDGKAYERWLLNQTNFDKTLAAEYKGQAKLAVRDDYNFDFLELADPHLERELEEQLLLKISQFLTELGGYFSFVGRRFRLEVDEQEFFIDLLFYNRQLQCLVALELKTGEFKPEYGSKMNFYLSALNNTEKLPHENPAIGIIVCRTKNRTIVEYTLHGITSPIGVATYNHYASLKELPERISRYLPSAQEIETRLIDLGE